MTAALSPAALSVPAGSGLPGWLRTSEGISWRLVDLDDPLLCDPQSILDSNERERASRFRFERDRSRYVAAHVALRLSLSEVLQQNPSQIEFHVGPFGKPALSPDLGWVFNLSHSEGIALIAIARNDHTDIGADIEVVRHVDDWHALAQEHFSEAERHVLSQGQSCASDFLRCWTRKEACVKALGTGLSLHTSGFTAGVEATECEVLIDAGSGARCVYVRTILETTTLIAALAYCAADEAKLDRNSILSQISVNRDPSL